PRGLREQNGTLRGRMTSPVVEVRQPGRRPLLLVVRDHLDVGRDCDGLLLADPEVSRRHARLEAKGDALTVVDLGSTNGTTVNRELVTVARTLTTNDVVQVGATEIRLQAPPAAPSPAAVKTAEPGSTAVVDKAARFAHLDIDPAADPRQTSIERVAELVS